MEEKMKKVGRGMSIRMGLLMSCCLSLVGMGTSGHFTVPGFIISFIVSTIISMIIGFLIPMGKITNILAGKLGLRQGTLAERLFASLISNLIYTPIITFVMVFLAYQMVMKQSGGMAQISFAGMFFPSLIICFIVGYVLIFIFQPIFLKRLMARC
ncbi:hypothetical protein [Butyrivibrio sp. VCB2006]|uniref:hypothetical protein n=1 Tax=Butyrivibrio sp. VCB2006 TaxID=1280679 RepID=UPI0003FCD73A|nr:hypothetical protein [Butyrivibrio sp. VCB2006]